MIDKQLNFVESFLFGYFFFLICNTAVEFVSILSSFFLVVSYSNESFGTHICLTIPYITQYSPLNPIFPSYSPPLFPFPHHPLPSSLPPTSLKKKTRSLKSCQILSLIPGNQLDAQNNIETNTLLCISGVREQITHTSF